MAESRIFDDRLQAADPLEPAASVRRRSNAIGAGLRQAWEPLLSQPQPKDLLDLLKSLGADPWTSAAPDAETRPTAA